MRTSSSNKKPGSNAWTLIELLVIIAVLAILGTMIDFGLPPSAKRKAIQINCLNNLKQIGLAYHIWAADHNGQFPMAVSVTNGGAMELASTDAWKSFQLLSNELQIPRILMCPGDSQQIPQATNFSAELKPKISYFIGLDATTNRPTTWLTGDDNFETNSIRTKSGVVELKANPPPVWSKTRHQRSGNILLADGFVLIVSNTNIAAQLSRTGLATNRIVIP